MLLKEFPCRGEIKLWTDGDAARARIHAKTRSGPLLLESSVPLAIVRAYVLRALAARGFPLHDAGPKAQAAETIVGKFGRRLALRRLKRAVPSAFKPGGLAARLLVKQLRERGLPLAALLSQSAVPGVLPTRLALQALLSRRAPGASSTAGTASMEGVGLHDVVGLRAPAVISSKVQAGVRLLKAAGSDPKALARIKNIRALATAGSPAGKAALSTLQAASRLRRRQAQPAAVPAAAAQALQSSRARDVPRGAGGQPGRPTGPGPFRRIFRDWQRGVE
jgi:hypothetical protein